jgi:peptidoglycan/LPS O-acetylase OafA/YrhL
VAAALIVAYHSAYSFGATSRAMGPVGLSQGVSFFFVLSGFILAHVYPSVRAHGAPRFLLARLARVWPAHLATLLLATILLPPQVWGAKPEEPSDFFQAALAHATLTQSWAPTAGHHYAFNPVSWSVSVEWAFYLLFPLLIHNWARTWKPKLAFSLALAGGVVALAGRAAGEGRAIDMMNLVYFQPLARLWEFTLGMAAALAYMALRTRGWPGARGCTLLETLAFGLAALAIWQSEGLARTLRESGWVSPAVEIWLQRGGVSCLAFALLIIVMALGRGLLSRLLSLRVFVVLGEISYSVYLVHHILLRLHSEREEFFADLPLGLSYALYWLVTLVAAWVMWTLVEKPCRRGMLSLWPTAGAQVPALAPDAAIGSRRDAPA